jgi:hypothetical protein
MVGMDRMPGAHQCFEGRDDARAFGICCRLRADGDRQRSGHDKKDSEPAAHAPPAARERPDARRRHASHLDPAPAVPAFRQTQVGYSFVACGN